MSNYVVIVDFSHMFHRCFAIAMSAPAHFDLIDTIVYHVQGVLRTLRKALEKKGVVEYDLVFAEDRVPWRKLNLLSCYRSNRTTNHAAKKQSVKEKLKERGVKGYWCHSEGNEADDVIATLVNLSSARGLFSIIVTADKDLWQLISHTTSVFNPKTKELVTLADVGQAFPWKNFSVKPSQVALVKALWGDAGDCIPNPIPRTQKALLPILIQCDGTYQHFTSLLESQWETLTETCREKLTIGLHQCAINWQLVKLDDNCILKWN